MSVVVLPHDDSESDFTVTVNATDLIHTTVTSSSASVAAWISGILSTHDLSDLIVGLDCEWRPSTSSSCQFPVAILQLCVSRQCLIFQLLHREDSDPIPSALADFLSDSRFKFVGVGIEEDVERMLVDHEIGVKNLVDLRALAAEKMGRKDLKQTGLAKLAKEVMGVEVKKPQRVRMSRWDQEVLMLDQIGYACVDAFLSFEIGRRLFAADF